MTKRLKPTSVFLLLSLCALMETYAQPLTFNTKRIEALIGEWNNAHNDRELEAFDLVFDEEVLFYAETMSRSKARLLKKLLFVRNPDYKQRIASDVKYTLHRNGVVKCEFQKEQWVKGTWQSSDTYLLIGFKHHGYWIIGESDVATDEKYHFRPKIGEPLHVEIVAASHNGPSRLASEKLSITTVSSRPQSDGPSAWSKTFFLFGILAFLGAGFMIIVFRDTLTLSSFRLAFSSYKQSFADAMAMVVTPRANEKAETVVALEEEEEDIIEPRQINGEETYHIIEHALKQDSFKTYVMKLFNPLIFTCFEVADDKKKEEDGTRSAYPKLDVEYRGGKTSRARIRIQCAYLEDGVDDNIFPLVNLDAAPPQQSVPSYVILGLGGPPESPDKVFLIPIEQWSSIQSKAQLQPMRRTGLFSYDAETRTLK